MAGTYARARQATGESLGEMLPRCLEPLPRREIWLGFAPSAMLRVTQRPGSAAIAPQSAPGGPILPVLRSRWGNIGPKMGQHSAQEGAKLGPDGPRWAYLARIAAKMGQHSAQDGAT